MARYQGYGRPPKHSGWSVGNRNSNRRGLRLWQQAKAKPGKTKGRCAVLILVGLGAVTWSTWWAWSHLSNILGS